MTIKLNEKEILRILDWFYYSNTEGHIDDEDDEIYDKLEKSLEN